MAHLAEGLSWPETILTAVANISTPIRVRRVADIGFRLHPQGGGILEQLADGSYEHSTLVGWASEFGRSPLSQNLTAGDHNPRGFTMWLSGGGVKGGVVHGATDQYGYKAVENRHYYSDLHATIMKQMDLDYKKMEPPVFGRTMRLVEDGQGPINEILA